MSKLNMDPNRRESERERRCGPPFVAVKSKMVAAPQSPTAHSNKNMRNLDNQMMLYFSDKSLIFKLYYYILVNTETLTHTRRQKKSNLLIIH